MISVAMATYNGEKYIKRQIESILRNLGPKDELVISDDGSKDRTLDIIRSFRDDRIKLFEGPGGSIHKNFENAIRNCSGDIIFLSDQDDFWYPGKVAAVLKEFDRTGADLVEHDAVVKTDDGSILYPSFFRYRRVRRGPLRNIMRNTYHGCLMAFRAELREKILPIPTEGALPDQWIGILADHYGKVSFLDEKLMDYYRHPGNASSFKHLSFRRQLMDRLKLIHNYCRRVNNIVHDK